GLIVRHHNFENFPQGTTPHTTAPLDYLIVALAVALKPLTAHAIDLAGAVVSSLLALIGGWFLWWWSRQMNFRYRWVMLILYALSPILVHGTELGRPDHQSLLMLRLTIAICAEWSLRSELTSRWSAMSGIAWALAVWVSAYEPLVLFFIVLAVGLVRDRNRIFAKYREGGWIWFGVCMAMVFVLSLFPILRDWDARVWPSEAEYARRIERRNESVQLRDLAVTLQSAETRAFLAPWWLSPSIGYWSRQPAVAGSSHESLPGI